jgi:hypothetical protein
MRAALEQQDGTIVHVDLAGIDGAEPIAVICDVGPGVVARYDRVMQGETPCSREGLPLYRFASAHIDGRAPKA